MQISEVTGVLELLAAPALQEGYDNAGLITGDLRWLCNGVLCSLDATEEVVEEAIQKNCNLIVAHHPIIFRGLKNITGKNYIEKTIIKAIKNDIAIYAIHTNLDNIISGVNRRIADKMGLQNCSVLAPSAIALKKLYTFVPLSHADQVRQALFSVGAGHIGQYDNCSFNAPGFGTFKALDGANPFVGGHGELHREEEIRIETVFPFYLEKKLLKVLFESHPYEEVAYDIIALTNQHPGMGAGIVGSLPEKAGEEEFLSMLKATFNLPVIRHTTFTGKKIKKVALCGGAGSFLIPNALALEADVFVTADLKYHEFFDADGKLLLADIGHYESEQFTIDLLADYLEQKFPTFAVLKTTVNTNPVRYFQ